MVLVKDQKAGRFGFFEVSSFSSAVDKRQQKKKAVVKLREVVKGHLRSVLPCHQVTWRVSSELIVPSLKGDQCVQGTMMVGLH